MSTLIQRLKIALGLTRGEKVIAALRPSWQSMTPTYATGPGFETVVREAYRKNELIYACINRTAATGAQIKIQMLDPAGEEVERHPLLDLIRKPNPNMNEAEFWGAAITLQKLSGRAVFEIERSNGGQPIALWPLRPDWVRVIMDANRPVPTAYLYEIPGLPVQTLPAADVLDFPLFDPLGSFSTFAPVAVAARVVDVDNAATDFIKLIWESGGVPMGLLKTTQVLQDTDVEDIRRRWRERYGGYQNWIDPAVLDRDAEYQRVGLTFNELGFDMLDARDEARICMALDVPPILVGAKVGLDKATYSNYETAQKAWWQNSIIPLYNSLLDAVSSQLLSQMAAPGYSLSWDMTAVTAIQESTDAIFKRAVDGFRAGLFTLNETLALVGQPQQAQGDYYLRPSSVEMVPLSEAAVKPEPPPQLAPFTGQEPPENEPEPTQDGSGEDEETESTEKAELKRITAFLEGLPHD